MRSVIVLNLVCLTLLCPFICGAADADQGTHNHLPSPCSGEAPATPAHCPDEGATCLCQGALRTSEVRLNNLVVAGPLAFGDLHLDLTSALPAQGVTQLLRDGRPTGLMASGDARTVRALLQNFRC